MSKSKKGTWLQAFSSLFFSIILVLAMRWLLVEAYVIPSGSMLPTLKINDHIFVNKLAYGVRLPFSSKWMLKYRSVDRGEVVVFRSVSDSEVFMIKRVIGVAGDKINYTMDGQLSINDQAVERKKMSGRREFKERLNGVNYVTWFDEELDWHLSYSGTVPPGHFFVMGDNRDNSSDSRVWGFVPEENVLGVPLFVWLSCDSEQVHAVAQCAPEKIRWNRFGKVVR